MASSADVYPLVDIATGIYRLLLTCYPRRFRREAERELLESFRESWARARRAGPTARIRLATMLLLDFVGSAPPEWWAERTAFQPTGRRATRMDNFFQDLRYALRSFRVAPTATLVTALTIALGIGATTTIFSAANALLPPPPAPALPTPPGTGAPPPIFSAAKALLLRPPAGVSDPDRLVTVHAMSEDGSSFPSFSYLDYRDLAAPPSGPA